MHGPANIQFERAVAEFAEWRAIAEEERSPAPAWWWGPGFEARDIAHAMPAECCAGLELPDGSSFADGAAVFLNTLAGQTSLPWPGDFPRRAGPSNPA